MTVIERDISLAEAARLTGHSPRTLRAVWHEIPSAYVSEGGRYFVDPADLRAWKSQRNTEARAATRAS